jgi:N-acetylneuraminic acid mutarotase
MAVLGQSLYSFAGLCPSGDSPHDTFEHAMFIDVYDSKYDTWTSVTTLMTPRCDPGIAVVGSDLYIMGGMDLQDIMGVDTVERYDSATGIWSRMTALPSIRAGTQCVAYVK